jgi:hypothetical protein
VVESSDKELTNINLLEIRQATVIIISYGKKYGKIRQCRKSTERIKTEWPSTILHLLE